MFLNIIYNAVFLPAHPTWPVCGPWNTISSDIPRLNKNGVSSGPFSKTASGLFHPLLNLQCVKQSYTQQQLHLHSLIVCYWLLVCDG